MSTRFELRDAELAHQLSIMCMYMKQVSVTIQMAPGVTLIDRELEDEEID